MTEVGATRKQTWIFWAQEKTRMVERARSIFTTQTTIRQEVTNLSLTSAGSRIPKPLKPPLALQVPEPATIVSPRVIRWQAGLACVRSPLVWPTLPISTLPHMEEYRRQVLRLYNRE